MIRKKKIAFVTPFYSPANLTGSSIVIKQLAEELVRMGFDISVITSPALSRRYWYDPFLTKGIYGFSKINGVKVYRLKCNQFFSAFFYISVKYYRFLLPEFLYNRFLLFYRGPHFRGLTKFLQNNKFDVIYSSPMPFYLNRQVANSLPLLFPRPKFILRADAHTLMPEYRNPELKKIFQMADWVIAVTQCERENLKKLFNIPVSKIIVVSNGLNLKKLKNVKQLQNDVKKFKKRKGITGKKIILFAGTKSFYKGVIILLEAVEELYKLDKSYLLITIGEDTKEWIRAKKSVDKNCVMDLGYVDEKQKELLFALSDVYCMPSIIEAFGLAYLDAWHKKKPVIGADTEVSRELIISSKGGLTVEFKNKTQLIMAIRTLFKNPGLAKKMGDNGYKMLRKNFTFNKTVKKYEGSLFFL